MVRSSHLLSHTTQFFRHHIPTGFVIFGLLELTIFMRAFYGASELRFMSTEGKTYADPLAPKAFVFSISILNSLIAMGAYKRGSNQSFVGGGPCGERLGTGHAASGVPVLLRTDVLPRPWRAGTGRRLKLLPSSPQWARSIAAPGWMSSPNPNNIMKGAMSFVGSRPERVRYHQYNCSMICIMSRITICSWTRLVCSRLPRLYSSERVLIEGARRTYPGGKGYCTPPGSGRSPVPSCVCLDSRYTL